VAPEASCLWSFFDFCRMLLGQLFPFKISSTRHLARVRVSTDAYSPHYTLTNVVGGLIVLGIFIKLWDIGHCTEVFDTFTRQFFGVHLTKGRGFLSRVRDYFRCWLSDGCYNVVVLEEMLKSIFGAEQRIFDINTQRVSGCKVAVTATTLSDASAYLFTNYNGGGIRERNCGSS